MPLHLHVAMGHWFLRKNSSHQMAAKLKSSRFNCYPLYWPKTSSTQRNTASVISCKGNALVRFQGPGPKYQFFSIIFWLTNIWGLSFDCSFFFFLKHCRLNIGSHRLIHATQVLYHWTTWPSILRQGLTELPRLILNLLCNPDIPWNYDAFVS